jgi:hypothetical protein
MRARQDKSGGPGQKNKEAKRKPNRISELNRIESHLADFACFCYCYWPSPRTVGLQTHTIYNRASQSRNGGGYFFATRQTRHRHYVYV